MAEHSGDLVANLVRSRKVNGRSVYDKAAKRELVRRCLQPGVSLARTALDHGVNANLLRKWVRQQIGKPAREGSNLPALPYAPLLAVKTTRAVRTAQSTEGYLELLVAGGTIRIHGRIDAQTLSLALECLARRA